MGTLYSGTYSLPLHVQQPLMPIMHEILDFLLDGNRPREKARDLSLSLSVC